MIEAPVPRQAELFGKVKRLTRHLPGVAISRFVELFRKVLRSSAGFVSPPSSNCGIILNDFAGIFGMSSSAAGCRAAAEGGWNLRRDSRTWCICTASSRVGASIIAPMWCFLSGCSRRRRRAITGIRKLSVLPLPVTA